MMAGALPHGREAVREALLDAALTLYRQRSPTRVSVREVAREAGVNHGLVHRYFGSKEELVRASLALLAARIDDEMAHVDAHRRPLAALTAMARGGNWRVLTRVLMDDLAPQALLSNFPVMKRLLAQVKQAQQRGALDESHDTRVVVALATAMGLGWLLFEPFLLASTGLAEEGEEEARRMALRTVTSLLAGL